MSLAVFDDTLVTQHAEPPLTSIRQDNHAIGVNVVELPVEPLVERACPPRRVVYQSPIVRRSTAPLERR